MTTAMSAPHHARATTPDAPPGAGDRRTLRATAAVLALGVAAIYGRVAPQYFGVYPPFGLGALAAGLAALAAAVMALARPTRRRCAGAAAGSLALIAVWAASRTSGLPVGPAPWRADDVGFTDLVCVALEAVAALLFVRLARRPRATRPGRPRRAALATAPALLLASALTVVAAGTATYGPASTSPLVAPPGARTTLTYCRLGGNALAMDLYEPPAAAARPAPAVLYVHGGGWIMGDRQPGGPGAGMANSPGAFFPALQRELNARGFVVAAIDYRLAPLHPWPAPIEDARCAVRFLRAQAGELGIDPGRIGAWGSSAGGQLVALLGLAGPDAGFDVGPYRAQSGRVQVVVDLFGPGDFTRAGDFGPFPRVLIALSLGRDAAVRRAASPVTYAGPDSPPFLILHGAADTEVAPAQSRELASRLAAAGTPVTLVLVAGAGHGFDVPTARPAPAELTQMVADFFARTLAPDPGR
ncbi:MAG TPA: alpha/beta hydrolase [Thermomicrobiales bacterium]|nr:alpha/beta hydrolase [Thermomicrobiales bacterium]